VFSDNFVNLPAVGGRLELLDLEGDPERKPLVLLHEGLGSVSLWRLFPEQLREATGRRVLAFSRFGHGASAPPPQPRTPAFFGEEALRVLPALLAEVHAPHPILVGHSDGGSISILHAARHPVTGLVLIAPHVFVEEVTIERIAGVREAYLRGDLRDRLARHHRDPDAAFWGWCDVWLDDDFRTWTIEREVRFIDSPTLTIQGLEDPYGTLLQLDRIEQRLRADGRRLHGPGGHSPHLEAGEQVVAAVADFCRDLP
jgi:pimeloyl-ACP methyl ester carboxylesterase